MTRAYDPKQVNDRPQHTEIYPAIVKWTTQGAGRRASCDRSFSNSDNKLRPCAPLACPLQGVLLLLICNAAAADTRGTDEPISAPMIALIVLIASVLLVQSFAIVLLWIQRRRLQRSLQEARQLGINLAEAARRAAVGEMAAIVSHYIAQPLTAMLLNAEAATAELQSSDPNREHLREIVNDLRTDAARVTALLDRLRGASKTEQYEFQLVDLNELATGIVRLIETAARQLGIEVRTDFAPGLANIRGSPIQLQEVLLSLLMGALNQLRTMSGQRVLTIRTTQRGGDIGVAVHHTGVAADRAPGEQDRSNDVPSFRDLSLAIVRAILDAHGGRIWTESLPDGAVLGFFVPAQAGTS